jgi:NAD(P)-dependent dehydrogenase (short-subunit alcohol dehydrogenase family)
MASIEASELLRPGLLQGVSVLIAGEAFAPPASIGASVHGACAELGARVRAVAPVDDSAAGEEDAAMGEVVEGAVAELEGLSMLVVDAAGLFAAYAIGATAGAPEGEEDRARTALRRCLQDSWCVTRAAANVAFLPREQGGRIVYIAPRPRSGAHADAARAGLENLARTLSIEWSRHAVTAVAIAPGEATSEQEVAALTAYLASTAGSYFSGCLLDLRGPVA